MRVLSQTELMRLIWQELAVLLRRIAGELAMLKEGSPELPHGQANLQNLRRLLARWDSGRAELVASTFDLFGSALPGYVRSS